jgi:hypothetical protein
LLLQFLLVIVSQVLLEFKMIGRRLMSDKWVKEGQKQLDDMLTTNEPSEPEA